MFLFTIEFLNKSFNLLRGTSVTKTKACTAFPHIISLAAAPVLLAVSRYFMKKMQRQRRKLSRLNSDIMSFESDTFTDYDMIKSFGITDFYNRSLSSWHGKYEEENLKYNKIQISSSVVMSVTGALVSAGSLAYCLYRLSQGRLLYGDMTFFLSQRKNVSSRFNSIVGAFPGLLSSAVAAQRVRELCELCPEEHNEDALSELASSRSITVKMKDVAFSYNENAEIYRSADFIARPGEIVTLLGPSGEGKTTLLRMILALISPDKGEITLIGSDGRESAANADLRRLISYVPQGASTVAGTVAENMRMVKEDATDDEIITALKTACAWEFVKELPDGINTYIGINKELRERGRGISEGQAQRLSIARAILRDAPILLLDEATSALDEETEARVIHNVLSASPNKTIVVSTHRLSMLIKCNRIYRIINKTMEEGRLVRKDQEASDTKEGEQK